MESCSFLTPICYSHSKKSWKERLLETVDSYLYLGGKKAYVIRKEDGVEKFVLVKERASAISTALKIVSYCTLILPLLALLGKAVLRSSHNFQPLNVREGLETGIEITPQMIGQVQEAIQDPNREKITAFFSSYKIQGIKGLVFKMGIDDRSTRSEFDNMVAAKTIAQAYNLDRLYVPHAKMFSINLDGESRYVIAKEEVNIETEESIHAKLYETEDPKFDKTVWQLATFVGQTGLQVIPGNIPLLHSDTTRTKAVLIDLGDFGNRKAGMMGLIRCVSHEKHIDIIIKEASAQGITLPRIQECKRERLEEVAAR